MKVVIWFQITAKLIVAMRLVTSSATPLNQFPISIPPWSFSGAFPPYPEGVQARDCGVCHCEGNRFISCQEKDTLEVIPSFSTPGKRNVFQAIFIRNQANFTVLDSSSLRQYPKLKELSIVDSGLRIIAEDAFDHNYHLSKLDLRNNKLKTISWKPFSSLISPEINLDRNPFDCVCQLKWIQETIRQQIENLSTFGGNWPRVTSLALNKLTCHDFQGNQHFIQKFNFGSKCKIPSIHLNESEIRRKENGSFSVLCSAEGEPKPMVEWRIQNLMSKVHLSDLSESSQILVVENTVGDDTGNITCQTENIVGRVHTSLRLIVDAPPKIITLEVRQNFHWCIYYELKGQPPPNRTWYFNDEYLLHSNDIVDVSESPLRGCLQFESDGFNREGVYMLAVSNSHGSTNRSLPVRFHHQKPPSMDGFNSSSPIVPPPFHSLPPHFIDSFNSSSKAENEGKEIEPETTYTQSIIIVATFSIGVVVVLILSAVFVFWARKQWQEKTSVDGVNNRVFRLANLFSSNSQRPFSYEANDVNNLRLFRRETMPLNATALTENPQYESQSPLGQVTVSEPEDIKANPIPPTMIPPDVPEYQVISSSCLHTLKDLGEGAFGRVHLAEYNPSPSVSDSSPEKILVAVKVLKFTSDDSKKDFDREAALLASITHSNIVQCFGACIDEIPWKMVFEYMEHGDLNEFLRMRGPDSHLLAARHDPAIISQCPDEDNNSSSEPPRKLSLLNLLQMSKDISAGMEYLASKVLWRVAHYVHRDLATRNCLVGKNLTVKIGDFGMSRDIYSSDYYRVGGQTLLPIRWMPPESILYRKFTGESDAWSFGVVLWEIFSFGKQPWYGHSNVEVIQQVTGGHVLPIPTDCPSDAYEIMLRCWKTQPNQRITMKVANQRLAELCSPTKNSDSSLYLHVIE